MQRRECLPSARIAPKQRRLWVTGSLALLTLLATTHLCMNPFQCRSPDHYPAQMLMDPTSDAHVRTWRTVNVRVTAYGLLVLDAAGSIFWAADFQQLGSPAFIILISTHASTATSATSSPASTGAASSTGTAAVADLLPGMSDSHSSVQQQAAGPPGQFAIMLRPSLHAVPLILASPSWHALLGAANGMASRRLGVTLTGGRDCVCLCGFLMSNVQSCT